MMAMTTRNTMTWVLEKADMNWEMGSSGMTHGSMRVSRVHPNWELSLPSCTQTESTLSVGTMRMSATTRWSPLRTVNESVCMPPRYSSGICRKRVRLSAFTMKL